MSTPLNAAAAPQEKPKFKIRKKHVKKAITVTIYAFVAFVMVASMVTPLWMQ